MGVVRALRGPAAALLEKGRRRARRLGEHDRLARRAEPDFAVGLVRDLLHQELVVAGREVVDPAEAAERVEHGLAVRHVRAVAQRRPAHPDRPRADGDEAEKLQRRDIGCRAARRIKHRAGDERRHRTERPGHRPNPARRHEAVGVGRQDDVAARFADSLFDCALFMRPRPVGVFHHLDEPEARRLAVVEPGGHGGCHPRHARADDRGGPVFGEVVGDDYFEALRRVVIREDRVEARADVRFFVARRDDHGDERLRGCGRTGPRSEHALEPDGEAPDHERVDRPRAE